MTQEFDTEWRKRVQAIFLKLKSRYAFEGPFYLFGVMEYLIQNFKITEARECFSYLVYCVEKHLNFNKSGDSLQYFYQSSAFLDLKMHFRPIIIDQSKLCYYMERVEEYLIDDSHGCSSWYFEVDNQNNIIRQVLKFDNMPYQYYSYAFFEDDKGGLTTHRLDNRYIKSLIGIKETYFEKLWINQLKE